MNQLGLKFRRQHRIGPFVVDFYCVESRLVIEVDGPIHESQAHADAERQEYLGALGLQVLRFSNDEVLTNANNVFAAIKRATSSAKSPLASQGEGAGGEVPPEGEAAPLVGSEVHA
jgi:very-short-patch-repair endonuclease